MDGTFIFNRKLELARSPLDAITATLFTDVDEALTASQDVLPVPGIAYLASKAPSRRAVGDSLETTRMLTLVVMLEILENLMESCKSLVGQDVWGCISFHNLFCSFFNAIDVCCSATTVLPLYATYIAEFGAANASFCC